MSYVEYLNSALIPKPVANLPLVVDLFAGCGGLSLGFEAAGFRTVGYEMNAEASASYSKNLFGECHTQKLSVGVSYTQEAKVLIGGPPCQPFSVIGNQRGIMDSRDGFPIFIDAVDRLRPEIFMFENVRGILYRNREYLGQIIERLRSFGYSVKSSVLNSKHFGVPQNRERIVVVGSRKNFEFPEPSHDEVTAGQAIRDLIELPVSERYFLTPSMDAYIERYEIASKCVTPRDLHLNKPARTVTCRNIAGATSDMHRVKLASGRRRMLTVREAARLQSFPDWFEFQGSEQEQLKQVGNAVAPLFAFALAKKFRNYLENDGNRHGPYPNEMQQELFHV